MLDIKASATFCKIWCDLYGKFWRGAQTKLLMTKPRIRICANLEDLCFAPIDYVSQVGRCLCVDAQKVRIGLILSHCTFGEDYV